MRCWNAVSGATGSGGVTRVAASGGGWRGEAGKGAGKDRTRSVICVPGRRTRLHDLALPLYALPWRARRVEHESRRQEGRGGRVRLTHRALESGRFILGHLLSSGGLERVCRE